MIILKQVKIIYKPNQEIFNKLIIIYAKHKFLQVNRIFKEFLVIFKMNEEIKNVKIMCGYKKKSK